jgi:hypothetical protein
VEGQELEYVLLKEWAEAELGPPLASLSTLGDIRGMLEALQGHFPADALPDGEAIIAAGGNREELLRLLKAARNNFHPDRFQLEVSYRKARAEVAFKAIGSCLP